MDGPLLILAGAGSGKTRVLTHRAAHLLATGRASLSEMLIVTFTNKAAREMCERVGRLLGIESMDRGFRVQNWITTFHSACTKILRSEIGFLGYEPTFVIYDSSDQLSMIKKVAEQIGLSEKAFPPKTLQSRINHVKTMGLTPLEVTKHPRFLMDRSTIEVYEKYEADMKRSNALDFNDLLLKAYEVLKKFPQVLHAYQNRFKFVMVDEYQDTNRIQYLIVKLLSESHRNLCVVGDEDQSIYSWRGADIGNILSFESDFPDCRVIKLEQNYRSTQVIVEAASHLIKNNSERKDKTLFTENEKGSLIEVAERTDEYDEARYTVQMIEQIRASEGLSLSDFAIFYRTNAQSRVLEEMLRGRSLAYRLVGGLKFYDRLEVKDILAYLRLTLNSVDDLAVKRIINRPTRGIGNTTVEKLQKISFESGVNLIEGAQRALQVGLLGTSAAKKVAEFLNLIETLRREAKEKTIREIYHLVLEKTRYQEVLRAEDTIESESRLENLRELDNALLQFERERGEEATTQNFLEEITLVSEIDSMEEDTDAITLMTLHVSKGLEFPVVFIVGMEEQLFPSAQSLNESERGVEEERRLAYVGMTRARQKLFLCYAQKRYLWGQTRFHGPSRFLDEIPLNFVNRKRVLAGAPSQSERARRFEPFPDYENETNFHYDEAPRSREESDSGEEFQKGMKVRHPHHGAGQICTVEGQGEWQKVTVLFSDRTMKKFIVKHARLERL